MRLSRQYLIMFAGINEVWAMEAVRLDILAGQVTVKEVLS